MLTPFTGEGNSGRRSRLEQNISPCLFLKKKICEEAELQIALMSIWSAFCHFNYSTFLKGGYFGKAKICSSSQLR